jgi:hypothetical protein
MWYQNTLHEIKGFPIAQKHNTNFVLTKRRLTNELVSNYGYSNGYEHVPNIIEHAYVVMRAALYGSTVYKGLYVFIT